MQKAGTISSRGVNSHEVSISPLGLPGTLNIPQDAYSLVIFAHGSGSSRLSPRNRIVADALNRHGIATLLFDLLKPDEENADNRAKVFDIPLLSVRLGDAVHWVDHSSILAGERIGLFGASTGAAAALVATARLGSRIGAVVSRGGRPDLAGSALALVRTPTLLIVGGEDHGVIALNQEAYRHIGGPKELVIVPGATHLFEEHGTLEQVMALAERWFRKHLYIPEMHPRRA